MSNLHSSVLGLKSERDPLQNQLQKAKRDHQGKDLKMDDAETTKSMEEVTISALAMQSVVEKDVHSECSKEVQVLKDAYAKAKADAQEYAKHWKLAVEAGMEFMEEGKLLNTQLKVKNEVIESLLAEVVQLKGDLGEATKSLADKDGASSNREKNIDSANKTTSTTRAELVVFQQLKEACHRAESEANQLKNTLADMENQLVDAESFVGTLKRQVTTLEEENALLRDESTALSNQLLIQSDKKKDVNLIGKIFGSATPSPLRALSKLTQSPGTPQSPSSPMASVRDNGSSPGTWHSPGMNHNIPHRLQTQLVGLRSASCVVCSESIHFGRQVSSCGECGATVHTNCVPHLRNNCGLPVGLAQHFVQLGSTPTKTSSAGVIHQGFVKIPWLGKGGSWDLKFMKIALHDGLKLFIFDEEPTSDLIEPIISFELRPSDGSTVSVHSALFQSELLTTSQTDDDSCFFMLKSVPKVNCWSARTLYFMAQSLSDKENWVAVLEKVLIRPSDPAVKAKSIAPSKPAVILSIGEGSPVPLLRDIGDDDSLNFERIKISITPSIVNVPDEENITHRK